MALDIQNKLSGFRASVIQTVAQMKLSDPAHISEQVQELWTHSTITWPRLLKSEEAWVIDPPPTTTKLVIATMDAIEASRNVPGGYTAYRRGERDAKIDPRIAIAQLIEPKKSDPVTIIGLNLLEAGSISVPLALSEIADAYDVANEQFLLTPKYAHTDLHIDTADGISIPVGQCVKLWLVFPPTAKNLALMSQADGQKAKLVRIGKKLEGGIVYQTTSEDAIYLPAGTLHAVFTLHGGFLASIDFITPKSSLPLSSLLAGDVDQLAPEPFRNEIFSRLLSSVDLALSNKQETLALSSWIAALERIVEYATGAPAWKADAAKMWKEFFGTVHSKKIICPCGNQGKDNLPKHFSKHISNHKAEAGKPGMPNDIEPRETRAAARKRKVEDDAAEGAEKEKSAKKVKR